MLSPYVVGTDNFSKQEDEKSLGMAREMATNKARFHNSDSIDQRRNEARKIMAVNQIQNQQQSR